MNKSNNLPLNYIAWSLTTLVVILAIAVWGANLQWHFSGLSIYLIFPIFGLIAFSVMWSHYVISFLNRTIYNQDSLKFYYKITGYIVLIAILFHPGLLAYQRFKDGFGLPPRSTLSYVAPNLRWVVLLGTISFLTFLAYELYRLFKDRSWWKYVVYANELAMLAIFYHGLKLGSNLHGGWFQYVWYFYGVILVLILGFYYSERLGITKYLKK